MRLCPTTSLLVRGMCEKIEIGQSSHIPQSQKRIVHISERKLMIVSHSAGGHVVLDWDLKMHRDVAELGYSEVPSEALCLQNPWPSQKRTREFKDRLKSTR